jgi:hypothetical protein
MGTFENTDDNELTATAEHTVAYVYGDTPPDFAAIAAAGFDVVALDSLAPWFTAATLASANANGLTAVGFPMSYSPLRPTTFRAKMDDGRRKAG